MIAITTTAFIQLQKFGDVAGYFRRWELWFHGVLTGAVVGAFFWILMRPRARFTRAILVAIATNWMAWALFLLLTPPLPDFEFQEIAKRATRDAGSGLDLMTDQPTILASRWFGGFRPMPISERLLFLMAGVPVLAASEYVVPARYAGDPPNRGESWVIAILGFSVSTAFWASVGGAIGWLQRRRAAVPAK